MIDDRLLHCAGQGNRECLRRLLKEIQQYVYTIAFYILQNELEAITASQEALVEIYKTVHKYNDNQAA